MRNPEMETVGMLVGEWALELSDAFFLEPAEVQQRGRATGRWLGDAFVELMAEMEGEHTWHFVFGRSDPDEQLYALYHDPRPTSRVFTMTFGEGEWTMLREDPDFHQRLIATYTQDRIDARFEASEDAGATWRKDFDLVFVREK
jgi:hypothetical protein